MTQRRSVAVLRRFFLLALCVTIISIVAPPLFADTTPFNLAGGNLSQNWSNAAQITTDDDWSGVPSITGFRGDAITGATGADPQTLLAADDPGVVDVIANQANPSTNATGGVAEFAIADPVVALQGSGTADAPYIKIYLNTTGRQNIQLAFNARDIDAAAADNSVQQIAVHYRVGNSGVWTNLPAGYIADASTGPSIATQVTAVSVTLPAGAENQSEVQIRVMTTNAVGNDEWIGIDDIVVSSDSAGPVTPTLNIDAVSQLEAANGGVMTFTVSLTSPAGPGGVQFNYETQAGTAIPPGDFTAISTTAGSIAAGNNSTTINVTIADDGVQEPDEAFNILITNIVNANAGDTTGEGTILNDDGAPTISVGDVTQAENSSATMTFQVSLSTPAPVGGVTFTIATSDGTATAGSDYTATTVTAHTILEGQQTYDFVVPISGDTQFEGNETFTVTISDITGADPGDLTATGTINNDDTQPNLTINDPFILEGAAGTQELVFTVSISAISAVNTTFDYATAASSATDGVDYIGESGSGTILAGATTTTISITINGDTAVEGNEDFLVNLTNVVNANPSDVLGIGVIMLDEPFSIAAINTPYSENFNTLGSTGTQGGTTPAAWTLDENGAAANALYTISNGAGTTGDTYSLGTTATADRAFGTLASNALQSTIGAYYANNTGATITTLSIAYTGEQWRLGQVDANVDRLDFAYSTDATALDNGTWTEVNALDFVSPIPANTGSVGTLDGNLAANRTAVGFTVSGLSIPNGGTFWLRFVDPNISGSDDALGVDDFSIIANIAGGVLTIDDVPVTEGDAGTVNAVFTVTLTQAAGPGGVTFDIATADGTATAGVDYVANSLTGQIIPEGQTTYQFTVVVNGDTDVENSETFFVNVTNVGGATLSDGQGVGTIASDDFTFTPIHTIQGSGLQSLLAGQVHTVDGIVTGIKSGGSGGFFVQEAGPYDADPNTSEGIFVFTGGSNPPAVVIGNRVAVTGTVTEFPSSANPHTVTELSGTVTVDLLDTNQTLPTPVVITTSDGAPSSNLSQYERYEGMRVSTTLTVVAPTDGSIDENDAIASSDGVFYGVVAGNARPFREPGIEQSYTIPPEAVCAACIDRFDENPEKIRVDSDNQPGATQLNVAAGQTVSNLTGNLDYGFFEYTLLPEAATVPIVSGDNTADPVPTPLATELTVSGFNLFHFFDDDDDPGVSEIELTTVAYQNRLQKASLAIRNILQTPDVIGVVEVDNITTLQDLAARIDADTLGVTDYFAYLEEGNDVGGIDVGFLVDLNRVSVQSVTQIGKETTWINPHTGLQDPSELNDRPSLVLEASILRPDLTVYEFTVIVNHLRSLIGIEENTAAGRRVRAKRAAQAEFLADYVQQRQTTDPTERIILVGDFNAFEVNDGFVDVMGTIKGSPAPATEVVEPTDDLVNPNLTNLIETLPADARYTYTFEGNAQAIDHALVNAAMLPSVSRFVVAHLDADYPNIFYSDFSRPERLADHDATLTYFDLSPLPQISIGDTSVVEGNAGTASLTFTVSLSGPALTTVTVDYATSNGSATTGSDYTGETGTVTFIAGDVSETITIDVTGDVFFEGDETVIVTLSNPSLNATINDGTATGTITNDDAPSGMFIVDNSANESAGTITFNVQLANPVPTTVTVDYTTVAGTATAGSDYTTTSGTLTFLANDQLETITVPILNDAIFEADETFTVVLSNATNTTTISDDTALGTITNDDTAVAIVIQDSSAAEDDGTMSFTVTLAAPVNTTVTVDYATSNGSATAGADYNATSGTVTFAPNDTSETIVVTLLSDALVEGDETFTVTLSNPSLAATIGDGTATGTIVDSDSAVADLTLQMSSAPPNPGPGQNVTFTITVTNNGPATATGVVVTDDLPNGMTFVSANSTQGSCTGTDPVQCTIGTLGAGQSATITIVASLPPNAAGPYVNTATADSNESDPTAPTASVTITLPVFDPAHIPTLSEWMLILMAGLLALFAATKLKL